MGFWLMHFEGVKLKDVTEARIYTAISEMTNRRAAENHRLHAQSLVKMGKDAPEYEQQPVSTSTKVKYLALMKALLRTAKRDWKWLEKTPVINVPQVSNKRVRRL